MREGAYHHRGHVTICCLTEGSGICAGSGFPTKCSTSWSWKLELWCYRSLPSWALRMGFGHVVDQNKDEMHVQMQCNLEYLLSYDSVRVNHLISIVEGNVEGLQERLPACLNEQISQQKQTARSDLPQSNWRAKHSAAESRSLCLNSQGWWQWNFDEEAYSLLHSQIEDYRVHYREGPL